MPIDDVLVTETGHGSSKRLLSNGTRTVSVVSL